MISRAHNSTTFAELIDADILSITDGYRAKNSELGGDGLIFLRAGHVADTHIEFSGVDRFREGDEQKLRSKISEPGDVVVTTKGNSTGRTAYVDETMPRFVYSPHLSRWRSHNLDVLDPLFLRYWSRSPEFADQLRGLAASTDMAPYLSLRDQLGLRITLPHIDEQRRIASILGSLDDKIEHNRRTAQALERLARAIFKAWFVDFEPVKAKAEGATSFPSMPQDVFDALPTIFVDTEIGPVPAGWGVRVATDVATVAIGKTPPRKERHWFTENPANVPWVSIKDMGQAGMFIGNSSEYLVPEAVERHRVRRIPDGSVLLSFKLTLGRVAIADGEITSNEAIAHFIPKERDTVGSEYLYCYLSSFDYARLGSTSSIATATNSKVVKGMPILVPPRDVAALFTKSNSPLFRLIRALGRESNRLANLRDYLLPGLISGDISAATADLQITDS